MRLYVDQMLREDLALLLRECGHDVLRAEESGQNRADDAEVLALACGETRTLITLDGHFGDWVVLPLSQHPGVIRVKVHPPTSDAIAAMLVPFLQTHTQEQLRNQLVILSTKRVRWITTYP
jgi:predicted nuclease of predicted toxin-antitoxin system